MSKLTPILAKLLKTSLEFIDHTLTNRIEDVDVKNSLDLVFLKLTDTIAVLADDNAADTDQIKTIWKVSKYKLQKDLNANNH